VYFAANYEKAGEKIKNYRYLTEQDKYGTVPRYRYWINVLVVKITTKKNEKKKFYRMVFGTVSIFF
jgi:hypothetical protein